MNQELMLLNEMDANLVWFKKHLNELKGKYDNTFVAIKEEEIIASNPNFDKLILDIKKIGANPVNILIQFISSIPVIL